MREWDGAGLKIFFGAVAGFDPMSLSIQNIFIHRFNAIINEMSNPLEPFGTGENSKKYSY